MTVVVLVRSNQGLQQIGEAVDVGRLVTHHAVDVVAEVPEADVVPHDDEDVGLVGSVGGGGDESAAKSAKQVSAFHG